jgi:hypothetical protein
MRTQGRNSRLVIEPLAYLQNVSHTGHPKCNLIRSQLLLKRRMGIPCPPTACRLRNSPSPSAFVRPSMTLSAMYSSTTAFIVTSCPVKHPALGDSLLHLILDSVLQWLDITLLRNPKHIITPHQHLPQLPRTPPID